MARYYRRFRFSRRFYKRKYYRRLKKYANRVSLNYYRAKIEINFQISKGNGINYITLHQLDTADGDILGPPEFAIANLGALMKNMNEFKQYQSLYDECMLLGTSVYVSPYLMNQQFDYSVFPGYCYLYHSNTNEQHYNPSIILSNNSVSKYFKNMNRHWISTTIPETTYFASFIGVNNSEAITSEGMSPRWYIRATLYVKFRKNKNQ